jgi:hypothetical protein
MVTCDRNGRALPVVKDTQPKRFFVVVNSSRSMPGTSGPVLSNHSSWTAAFKAASKKNGHYRPMEVKHALEIGLHVTHWFT